MNAGSVPQPAAAVEPLFAPDPPLAKANAARRKRAAERKRIEEIHGRYLQAFHELAELQASDDSAVASIAEARSAAWKVAHELVHARMLADPPPRKQGARG